MKPNGWIAAMALTFSALLSACGGDNQANPSTEADAGAQTVGSADDSAVSVASNNADSPVANATNGSQPADDASPATRYAGNPSFSCSGPVNRVERMICDSPALSRLDRRMAAEYTEARRNASPQEARRLQQTQRSFLADRNNCRDTDCIDDLYSAILDGLMSTNEAEPAAAAAVYRTSYNCRAGSLNRTETMICHDEELAANDVALAQAFREARDKLSAHGRDALQEEQRDFLARRNRCTDVGCVFDVQMDRLRDLQSFVDNN